MNVSSKTASSGKLKPFNASFLSTDDPRFSWLKNQFLKYFEEWLRSNEERPGAYAESGTHHHTHTEVWISLYNVIELVKFLIMH